MVTALLVYNDLVKLGLWATYLFDLNQYVFSLFSEKMYSTNSTLNVLSVFDVNLTSTLRPKFTRIWGPDFYKKFGICFSF